MSDRRVIYIGADGSRHILACSDEGYQLATNPAIWGVAPVSFGSRAVANIAGEKLETVRRLPRIIPLPFWIRAATELEADQLAGDLGRILHPHRDGRLIFERPDGSDREITVRCIDGASAITVEHGEFHWVKVPAVFKAWDPDWRSTTEDRGFDTDGFPDGKTSGILGVDIDNQGDLPAWPEWKITGPGENYELINLTTGQMFRIVEVLGVGDVVRIRTDPRDRGVWLNDVLNWRILEGTHELWPLVPGLNYIDYRAFSDASLQLGDFEATWVERFDTC